MNSLSIDLSNKEVIFSGDTQGDHPFLVTGGFGRLPVLMGTAIFGKFVGSEEGDRMNGLDVERLATPEEVDRAKQKSFSR